MANRSLTALAEAVEKSDALDDALALEAVAALDAKLPGRGVLAAFNTSKASGTDRIMELVTLALPGWQMRLNGTVRDTGGAWTCTLREAGVRDDDEDIGIGAAPGMGGAMLAALLVSVARHGG